MLFQSVPITEVTHQNYQVFQGFLLIFPGLRLGRSVIVLIYTHLIHLKINFERLSLKDLEIERSIRRFLKYVKTLEWSVQIHWKLLSVCQV